MQGHRFGGRVVDAKIVINQPNARARKERILSTKKGEKGPLDKYLLNGPPSDSTKDIL